MAHDRIYAGDTADEGPFEFSEAVARVFPDMLRRSIPVYAATIHAIGLLADRYVEAHTRCYDLGCSLGAATLAMRHGITVPGCRIVAIDNAAPMVARCREIVAEDEGDTPVDVICGDVRDADIRDASMAVMNYTLQFLPRDGRQAMIDRIAGGLRPGGILVLSEKVVHEDPTIEALLVDLHHEFKREQAYSELEISRKRAALEDVLVPDDIATHERRLRTAGFRHTGVWLRRFNFVSLVAVK